MQRITLDIDGMSCGHCVASVRSALTAVPGLELQEVRVGSAVVRTAGDARVAADAARAALQEAGYDATTTVVAAAEAPTATTTSGGACCARGTAPATPVTAQRS